MSIFLKIRDSFKISEKKVMSLENKEVNNEYL